MLKNSLFSPLCLAPFFCFSLFLFFFFSAPHTSFSFLFPVSHAAVLLQPSFSFLFVCCPLFFSLKYFFFSPNVFASAQNLFQFSPHHYFSLFLFCFSLFSFCLAPPFLLSFSAPNSLFPANFQGQKYSL